MRNSTRLEACPPLDRLTFLATKRRHNLFAADVSAHQAEIQEQISGSRILVIGGAGSIGAATVRELARFSPAALHVADFNENNLAELVRDLRSSWPSLDLANFRTLPLDFGSPIMLRFLMEQQPYDYVLNFAAIKHVRSEKDVPSILQMLDTNVLKPARLLDWIAAQGRTRVYFCVSTDKAANPANLMGASKRLMEHVIFSEAGAPWPGKAVTSARFANVAFSAGSLLASWVQRLMNRQPLAVPEKTRRFFISCAEAGTICLLASLCIPDRYLLVPKLYPETDLQDLQSIAEDFLHLHNLEPHLYYDETDAKMGLKTDIAQGRYPLLITPLDTVGEKPHEKFVANGEKVTEVGLAGLLGVVYQPCNTDHLLRFLKDVQEWLDNPSASITKQVIIESISALLNDFIYIGSKKNLDERM